MTDTSFLQTWSKEHSMEISQTTPAEAHEALSADPEAVYLDVRTELEFAAGHPAGAINVPVAVANPSGGMLLNPDFQSVLESILPRGTAIFCGCQSGGRSQTAAKILTEMEYTSVTNIRGGFGGVRDPSGQLLLAGWIDSGLPISTEVDVANSYAGLKLRVSL
jgi:rhodanese-related sulfurtransferase